MQVKGGPDLPGDEVDQAAQRRRGAGHGHGRVLVTECDMHRIQADNNRRPVLDAHRAPTHVSNEAVGMPADHCAPNGRGAAKGEIHAQHLGLHQGINTRLYLRDRGVGDRLPKRRRSRRRHRVDAVTSRDERVACCPQNAVRAGDALITLFDVEPHPPFVAHDSGETQSGRRLDCASKRDRFRH